MQEPTSDVTPKGDTPIPVSVPQVSSEQAKQNVQPTYVVYYPQYQQQPYNGQPPQPYNGQPPQPYNGLQQAGYQQVYPGQQPLLQNQYYAPPQQQYYQQPPIQPVVPPVIVLNHDLIELAGPEERKYFNMTIVFLLFIQQLFTLCLCFTSMNNSVMMHATYDPEFGRFTPFFYICCTTVIPILLMWIIARVDLFKKQPMAIMAYLTLTVAYAFSIQGVYCTSYYAYWDSYYRYTYIYQSDFGVYVQMSLGYLLLMLFGLIIAFYKENINLTQQSSNKYSATIPFVFTVIMLVFSYFNIVYLVIAYMITSVLGNYIVYIILKINRTGYQQLKSDDVVIAPVVVWATMLVPFYKTKEVPQTNV